MKPDDNAHGLSADVCREVCSHVPRRVGLAPMRIQIDRDVTCWGLELVVEVDERDSKLLSERAADRRFPGGAWTNQVNDALEHDEAKDTVLAQVQRDSCDGGVKIPTCQVATDSRSVKTGSFWT